MGSQRSFVERVIERIETHIEDWREHDRAHKAEAEVNRRRLWAEAAERERLLAEFMEQEAPPGGEKGLGRRMVFVVHSEEAARELEDLAARRACLSDVVPEKRSPGGVSGMKGTWLIFEEPGS